MKIRLLYAFLALCSVSNAQTALDTYLQNYMTTNHIPGMSACVVKNGKLAWAKGYGMANLQNNTPVTVNTVFMLASVSKTITSTALMNEWENGAFQLDDSVNSVLPWEIYNSFYPYSIPITFRHLLTHSSSIADNWNILDPYVIHGDSPLSLSDLMHNYLVEGESNYDPNLNYHQYVAGTGNDYSNVGAALCGYLVEPLSGTGFNQYCIDSIFTPLCMDNTSWFLSGIADSNTIAKPYLYSSGNYTDQGHYGFPDYPDGQLRTTATSLAKFLVMNMQYGRLGSVRVLDSTTVYLTRTAQIPSLNPDQGLMWYKSLSGSRQIWGHSGWYNGYATEMWMDESTKEGVIILCNVDADPLDAVISKLFLVADTINLSDKPLLTCSSTTTLVEESNIETEKITVYPNPFNSSASMVINSSINYSELNLYTVYGQKVKTINNISGNKIKIERGSLNTGVYFYELKASNNKTSTGKLIIAD